MYFMARCDIEINEDDLFSDFELLRDELIEILGKVIMCAHLNSHFS